MNVQASERWLTIANAVTAVRVVLVPVVALLLAQNTDAARWWACGVFVAASLTDTLDGYVARREAGGISRFGQLADPLADKLLVLGTLGVLAWQNVVPWWAFVVIAIREVGITVQRWVLSGRGVTMPADRFGKLKAVVQMAYLAVALAPGTPTWLTTPLLWLAVILTVGSGLAYVRHGFGRTG